MKNPKKNEVEAQLVKHGIPFPIKLNVIEYYLRDRMIAHKSAYARWFVQKKLDENRYFASLTTESAAKHAPLFTKFPSSNSSKRRLGAIVTAVIAGVRARSLRPKPLAPPPRLPHYLHASDVKKILDDMRDFQRAKLKALMDETNDQIMCKANFKRSFQAKLQRYNRQNKLQEEAWIKNNHLFREHFRLKSEDTTAYAREESTWAFGSQFTQWLQDEEGDDEEEDPNASEPFNFFDRFGSTTAQSFAPSPVTAEDDDIQGA